LLMLSPPPPGDERCHASATYWSFVARVERLGNSSNDAGVLAEDARRRSNDPPRVGLIAMMANERGALERFRSSRRAASVSWTVTSRAINWVFEMVVAEHGARVRMDESRTSSGAADKILHERYFYDPGAAVSASAPRTTFRTLGGSVGKRTRAMRPPSPVSALKLAGAAAYIAVWPTLMFLGGGQRPLSKAGSSPAGFWRCARP